MAIQFALEGEPWLSQLRLIIQKLSTNYSAVDFEPHVTFFSGPSDDSEIVIVAQELAAHARPIQLKRKSLAHSPLFTKTLFVQFAESGSLRDLYNHARNSCSQQTSYELKPHLSLLYQKIEEVEKEALCHALDVPDGPFSFDTIWAVKTESPFHTPAQILSWQVLCRAPIGSPSAC